jgi:hypothetical protein
MAIVYRHENRQQNVAAQLWMIEGKTDPFRANCCPNICVGACRKRLVVYNHSGLHERDIFGWGTAFHGLQY